MNVDPVDLRIGARLRRLRESRSLSLTALARLIGIDPGALERHENGVLPTPVSTVIRIARALDTSAAGLIGDDPSIDADPGAGRAGATAPSPVDIATASSTAPKDRVEHALVTLARTIANAERSAKDRR